MNLQNFPLKIFAFVREKLSHFSGRTAVEFEAQARIAVLIDNYLYTHMITGFRAWWRMSAVSRYLPDGTVMQPSLYGRTTARPDMRRTFEGIGKGYMANEGRRTGCSNIPRTTALLFVASSPTSVNAGRPPNLDMVRSRPIL